MRVIGTASESDLLEMKRRGVEPQAAVQAIIAEAKRRYPTTENVVLHRNNARGFDVVAL